MWFVSSQKQKPQRLTQHPPASSPHAPTHVHRIPGGDSAGLSKPKPKGR